MAPPKGRHKALAERVTVGVDELPRLELDRLDALQAALWPKAVAGDMAAAVVVLRIIERRARVLGLGLEHRPGPGTVQPTTVVVPELGGDHISVWLPANSCRPSAPLIPGGSCWTRP